MNRDRSGRKGGQILVLFALALVAIVAMVGLVLDGSSAFAQRRIEQNAADTAALAAANDLIVNQGGSNWQTTALAIAADNGYTDGANGVTVQVTCRNCPGQALDNAYDGVQVTVTITASHRNNFASIVGMSNWNVSTTATSLTGWPNTAHGPGPFIVSETAFDPNTGLPTTCTEAAPCSLLHPVNDTPANPTEFTWTDFHYDTPCHDPGNVTDSELQNYMDGSASFDLTLQFGCYIAQHNNGVMNNTIQAIRDLAPITFPVPIVDTAGDYVGWATFAVTSANANGSRAEDQTISGYFETGFQNQQLDVKGAGFGTSTYGGNYKLKLIN